LAERYGTHPALLDRFYAIVGESLPRALDAMLPPGVIVNERGAGEDRFVIAQNYTRQPQTITFAGTSLIDLETGESLVSRLELEPLGSRVLQKKR